MNRLGHTFCCLFFQKYSLETLRDPAPFPGGIAMKGHWKMVNDTALYNLANDSGERRNVASEHKEVFDELRGAYHKWYEEVMKEQATKVTPISVGYREENPIHLQPHHGKASGRIQFTGKRGLLGEKIGTHPRGVDGDWLSDWVNEEDSICWKVEIMKEGNYRIGTKMRDAMSTSSIHLSITVGDEMIPAYFNKGTLDEEWGVYDLGTIFLQKGVYEVSLSPSEELGENQLEIREVSFELL